MRAGTHSLSGELPVAFIEDRLEAGQCCRCPSMHPTALTASGLCRHTAAAQEMFDGSAATGTDIAFTWIYTCTVNKNKRSADRSADISGMITH